MTSSMYGESGYLRVDADAYFTPEWCTEVLLRHVTFPMSLLWEPAAGDGAMVRPLVRAGYSVVATDINPRADDITTEDFFETPGPEGATAIVTNPPYKLAKNFIGRALDLIMARHGIVAMLLRNEYDCAAGRQHLFGRNPFYAQKIVLTKRPRWFTDDRASPRHNFAWYVWDHSYPQLGISSGASAPVLKYDQ